MFSDFTDGWMKLKDGTIVYNQLWDAKDLKAIGVVVAMHGMGEHIGRHAEFFKFICSRGFKVISWDQRGFGKSAFDSIEGGRKSNWPIGHIGSRDLVLADLEEFISIAQKQNLPVFVFGQSMGGLFALDFLSSLTESHKISGIISCAPPLGIPDSSYPGFFLRNAGRIAFHVLPSLVIKNTLDHHKLCHDTGVCEDYVSDKLTTNKISLATAKYILDRGPAIARDPKVCSNCPPVLLLHGDADEITCCATTQNFARSLSKLGVDATVHVYQGYYHEILLEPDIKSQVMEDIVYWLKSKIK